MTDPGEALAAELAKKAAIAKELPSVRFDGDYGDIGKTPTNSHGTYSAAIVTLFLIRS